MCLGFCASKNFFGVLFGFAESEINLRCALTDSYNISNGSWSVSSSEPYAAFPAVRNTKLHPSQPRDNICMQL